MTRPVTKVKVVDVLFLDFTEIFDIVTHSILTVKLVRYVLESA